MFEHEPEENCGIERVISALAGRWKLLILFWLLQGPCRFNQLQRNLGRITHRTLTRQLTELAEAGLVARKDYRTIPPHVEYSLTPLGHSLVPVMETLHAWAAEHGAALLRHQDRQDQSGQDQSGQEKAASPRN